LWTSLPALSLGEAERGWPGRVRGRGFVD